MNHRWIVLCALLVITMFFGATGVASAERHALIIGITNYDNIGTSANSVNDAIAVRKKLRDFGFSDISYLEEKDATLDGFTTAWGNFLPKVKPGDDVVIYFSGHGFSYRDNNYLALKDVSDTRDHNIAIAKSKSVLELSQALSDHFVRIGLFVLEACRDDPFGHEDHGFSKGTTVLNRLEPSTDSSAIVVWYAASQGETASAKGSETGGGASTSLFTGIFLDRIDHYLDIDIERFAKELRAPVLKASSSDKEQHPWLASNLTFDWCFLECPKTDASPKVTTFQKKMNDQPLSSQSVNLVTNVSVNASNYQAYVAQNQIDGNAIFIGRRSAASTCKPAESDAHPFGCAILISLLNSEKVAQQNSAAEFVERPLTLETDTYLRLGLPRQLSATDSHALYGCIVGTYAKGRQVTLSKIVALNYNSDTYYWGIDKQRRHASCLNP
jgi:hypothetical protein